MPRVTVPREWICQLCGDVHRPVRQTIYALIDLALECFFQRAPHPLDPTWKNVGSRTGRLASSEYVCLSLTLPLVAMLYITSLRSKNLRTKVRWQPFRSQVLVSHLACFTILLN